MSLSQNVESHSERLKRIARTIGSSPVLGHYPSMMAAKDEEFLNNLAAKLETVEAETLEMVSMPSANGPLTMEGKARRIDLRQMLKEADVRKAVIKFHGGDSEKIDYDSHFIFAHVNKEVGQQLEEDLLYFGECFAVRLKDGTIARRNPMSYLAWAADCHNIQLQNDYSIAEDQGLHHFFKEFADRHPWVKSVDPLIGHRLELFKAGWDAHGRWIGAGQKVCES